MNVTYGGDPVLHKYISDLIQQRRTTPDLVIHHSSELLELGDEFVNIKHHIDKFFSIQHLNNRLPIQLFGPGFFADEFVNIPNLDQQLGLKIFFFGVFDLLQLLGSIVKFVYFGATYQYERFELSYTDDKFVYLGVRQQHEHLELCSIKKSVCIGSNQQHECPDQFFFFSAID